MKPKHFFQTHFNEEENEYKFKKLIQDSPYIQIKINGIDHFVNTVEYEDCTFYIYSPEKTLMGSDYAKMRDDLLRYAPGTLA